MESPTPFDLNEAICRWQENLASSPTFAGDTLEELASHLRASVQRLLADGLSEEEAFQIAARRIGERGLLEREFAKVNPAGGGLSARARDLNVRFAWFVALMTLSLVSSLLQPVGLIPGTSLFWEQPFSTWTLMGAFIVIGKKKPAAAEPYRPVSDSMLVLGFLGCLVAFYATVAVIIYYFQPADPHHTPIWEPVFDLLVRLVGIGYGCRVWRAQKAAMADAEGRA